MNRARKAHGDKVILDEVTLAFLPGAKIGVVGPNGAGKSTVLKIMAGLEQTSNGEARLTPGYSVGILLQEPPLNEELDVRGNVEEAVAELRQTLARFEQISEAMAEPDADFDVLLPEQGELMDKIEHADGWELDNRIEMALDALRCPPGDADVTVLSGGERRRVALCKLLLQQPDLLLLDEPTNHLDAESVQWLEQHLEKYEGTVVAVTHDRYFLDNVAQWILELDRGRAYPYEGNYSTYLEMKAARLKVEGQKDVKRQKRLADEHPEEGRLPCPIRPDDAHDAGSRQRERQLLDQQPVTEALGQVLSLDDQVAQPRTRRDLDLLEVQLASLLRLGGHLLVTREP